MQMQINTDSSIDGSGTVAAEAEAEVREALERFSDRITRVEVHLGDVNSHKSGQADKRCMMEARIAGRPPVAVTHHAATVPLAVSGAAEKLRRSLERTFDRLSAR